MTVYFDREATKLCRRIHTEAAIEILLLVENWKLILAGIVFQCVHGLASHGVHYLHRPGPTLQDAGFFILPELGQANAYISESLFGIIFSSFVLASQSLRIVTFYSTLLPGPNYHCREGSKLSRLPYPENAIDVLLINLPRGILYGCGDLIFSSHMIFTLVFVRTYQKYGSRRFIKQFAWLLAVSQSLLIVASRKHYTVDIVVAWYTVNLVVFFIDNKLPDLPHRSAGSAAFFMLPLSSRDKDGKSKEEYQKVLGGVSIGTLD